MKRNILRLLVALTVAAPIAATAQVTYDYEGATFTNQTVVGTSAFTAIAALDGDVILSAPLAQNGTTNVVPLYWGFNAANGNLSSTWASEAEPEVSSSSFSFTTVNGVITAWSMNMISGGGPGSNADWSVTSSASGDSYLYENWSFCGVGNCALISEQSTTSGRWTAVYTPEIDPSSAASSLTLLLGILVVLRGRRPQLPGRMMK
jgi:hypothetical protein